MNPMPLNLRKFLCDALMRFDQTCIATVREELYMVLKIAKEQGWAWSLRSVYGGGKEVTVSDGLDEIASIIILDYLPDVNVQVSFMEEYLSEKFEPTKLMPYNAELDAELRNEEILYGYEVPRTWRDAWYVQPKRNWGNIRRV